MLVPRRVVVCMGVCVSDILNISLNMFFHLCQDDSSKTLDVQANYFLNIY